ncbi:MAG: Mpo1-like protein [Candidatus Dormibacteria bacterium]
MIDLSEGVPGVNADEPKNFEDFWAFYLSQHLDPRTRLVHAVGTAAAFAVGITSILQRKPRRFLASPLLAYGPAFASHFILEKNRPATLGGHVLWSIGGDLRMLRKVATRTIDADVQTIRDALGMREDQVTLADWDRDRELIPPSIELPAPAPREVVAVN